MDKFSSEWLPIIAPLIALQLALAIYALYDMYKHGGARPPLPTWAWVLIIAIGQFWGPALYFFVGRKEDEY